jgi:G3E family GTPase
MGEYAGYIPVNLLTGFLGSGKTTLLSRLLASPQLARTAVLINEFGEVGLDHLLLDTIDEDAVLLQSGCICCTIRGDLRDAIRSLYDRRERGVIPPFDRLVIETTGLADPTPIISTLLADPVVKHHFRLGTVVTTVDAVNGLQHLAENPESVKQVAVADRIVLTKADIADQPVAEKVRAALRHLNPTAPVLDAQSGRIQPDALFTRDLYSPAGKSAEVRRWLAAEVAEAKTTATPIAT